MEKIEALNDRLTITWSLSHNCNFSCLYCPPILHQKNAFSPSLQDLQKIFKSLKKFFPKDRDTCLWFSGGEPSRISHLPEFVNLIKNENIDIEIGLNSNGSASYEYYDKLLKNVNSVNFSVHFDFIKYKAYFKKLMLLHKKYNNKMSFSVMVDKRHFTDVEKTCELLKKYNIEHNIIKIRGKGPFNEYSKEQLDFIKQYENVNRPLTIKVDNDKEYNDYEFQNLFTSYENFKGWKCSVPQQHLFLSESKLYAGICRIKSYGDLLKEVKSIDEYVICDGRKCACAADIRASKEKNY